MRAIIIIIIIIITIADENRSYMHENEIFKSSYISTKYNIILIWTVDSLQWKAIPST